MQVILILFPSPIKQKLNKRVKKTYLETLKDQSEGVRKRVFGSIGGEMLFLENTKSVLSERGSSKGERLEIIHKNFLQALVLDLKQNDEENKCVKIMPAKELLELQKRVFVSSKSLASFCRLNKWDIIASQIGVIQSYLTPDADDTDSDDDDDLQQKRKRSRSSQSPQPSETGEMSPTKNPKLAGEEIDKGK